MCYETLIDLFFYRHKIIQDYKSSRYVYRHTHEKYEELKQIVHEIADIDTNTNTNQNLSSENNSTLSNAISQLSSNIELKNYQDKLRKFPLLDFQYSECLAELNKYHLNIDTNIKNYTEKLRQIQEKTSEDLKYLHFLSVFDQIISVKFSNQIQTDLGYFAHTSGLIEKAITSIRSIIEIEEAERDRSLEQTFQVAAAAVGSGAIVSGVVAEHIDKPFASTINFKYPVHPLVSSLFWSVLATAFFGIVTWLIIKPKRKKNKQN